MMIKKSSYLPIVIGIIILGLIITGAILYASRNKPEFQPSTGDHIRGDASAPITLVEYSDFQCPFCSKFHPTVQQILDAYPGQVRWIYKHFPLDSIHPNARPAAEASECAAAQGKFWEFADGLFKNQSRLGTDLYQELAGNLGLNSEQFNQCVSSGKYKDRVQADYQEGLSKGVKGTPASFINGQSVSGAVPFEKLKSIIDSLL